jgi:ribosome-interacting GTPase 1
LPANLTAEAQAKWKEAQLAKNLKEKLRAYQEFYAAIPKHKGNERLRAQIKTKIAQLREDITTQRGKRGGSHSAWFVEREGAAQLVIIGPTKAGRSSLLRSLTNAQVVVASYDYTTQHPIPGMVPFEDIQLQLVEMPALQLGRDGKYHIPADALDLVRSSDGLILLVDLSSDPTRQLRSAIESLEEIHVSTQKSLSRVEIVQEKGSGEVRIAASSQQTSCSPEEIRALAHSYGIRNALLRIYGDASLRDIEDAIFENVTVHKPTIIIGNKLDLPGAREVSFEFIQTVPHSLPVIVTSCLTGQGMKNIAGTFFHTLGMIRVYTKEPSEARASQSPFVVKAGTTVKELAMNIHTDLAERYRYSRIWGPTSKFAGERVGPDHVLGDKDIVEIHTA